MSTPLSPCGDLVRRVDPDRFLLSLTVPTARREGLWALYGFHYEIARTRETVTEAPLGMIRLRWWGDAAAALCAGNTPPRNAVLEALAAAIKARALPPAPFEALVNARARDLDPAPFADLEALESYAAALHAPLMELAVRIAQDVDPTPQATNAVATGCALLGLLRAVPFHARQGRSLLPADIMAAEGVTAAALKTGRPETGLPAVIRTVANRAAALLDREPAARLSRVARLQARLHLRHLKACHFDLLDPKMTLPPSFYHLRFFTGNWRF